MAGSLPRVPFYAKTIVRGEVENAISNGVFYIAVSAQSSLAALDFIDLGINTGPAGGTTTALTQLSILLQSASLNIQLFEDSDWTDGTGTEVAPVNLNRVASAAGIDALRETVLRRDPTIVSEGTEILNWDAIGVTAAGNNDIVDLDLTLPLILKLNTKYLLRVTNTGGSGDFEAALQFIDRVIG